MAAQSPAAAASARPGASGPRVQRWRQAVPTASQRQAPPGCCTGKRRNAQPIPAASRAVHPVATVWPGSRMPPARKMPRAWMASSVRPPAQAAVRELPPLSHRPATAAASAPRQFEPHGHRLKEQTPRQRPHAGSQQIGRRTPDDQRQPEGRGAAVDLPGAQHRPRDSRGPLPGQRRPPRPRGQQRLQPERRSMYLLVGIGKDSHRSVPPLCCMPYGSCTIPRGNRRFLPQAGEIQKLVGNCAFVPRPDKPCRKSRQKSGVPGCRPQNNKKDGPRAQSSRRGRPQFREK